MLLVEISKLILDAQTNGCVFEFFNEKNGEKIGITLPF